MEGLGGVVFYLVEEDAELVWGVLVGLGVVRRRGLTRCLFHDCLRVFGELESDFGAIYV